MGDNAARQYEQEALAMGFLSVCGVDEAGRGSLAGPVVAACVVLPQRFGLEGVNDSKQLTAVQRDRLFPMITQHARGYGIGIVDNTEIDRINILNATHLAMRLAFHSLPAGLWCDLALIDGLPARGFPITQWAIVKGDSKSQSIAAASIIAKVTRDRIMEDLHSEYPDYNFAQNKGYPAGSHLQALARLGPCPVHRLTYKPVTVASTKC